MVNWDEKDELGVCTSDTEYRQVQEVCRYIGISCHRVELIKEYWNNVFKLMYLVSEYSNVFGKSKTTSANCSLKWPSLANQTLNKIFTLTSPTLILLECTQLPSEDSNLSL